MATYPWRNPPYESSLARWLVCGFISGAIAVLVFHQSTLAILHQLGMTAQAPFALGRTAPLGIPQVWSLAFWGGVWGIVLAAALRRLDGPALVLASLVFGMLLPTLVAWFVVAPLKGRPMAAGMVPSAMAVGLIVNAAWGLGTGIGLNLFGRSHIRRMLPG